MNTFEHARIKKIKYCSNITYEIVNNFYIPNQFSMLIAEEPFYSKILEEIIDLCKEPKIENTIERFHYSPFGRLVFDNKAEFRFFPYKNKNHLKFITHGQHDTMDNIYIYNTMNIEEDENFNILPLCLKIKKMFHEEKNKKLETYIHIYK